MKNNFRNASPARTCNEVYKNYRSYKAVIAKDFNNRCGYTDCRDFWFGGANNFHIDHFIPWKRNAHRPELKTSYTNLVYACSYVNIAKSDDEGSYLDPCYTDYNLHFSRDAVGHIIPDPKSPEAIYMYKQLKLFLMRYQIIWMLDALFDKMSKLQAAIESRADGQLRADLIVIHYNVSKQFNQYLRYLQVAQ